MIRRYIVQIIFSLFIGSSTLLPYSCKKDPITREIHGDTIILGNTVPNYTGVPTLNIKLYVNKLYVDLLGRQATTAELTTHINSLIQNNLSYAARNNIVTLLIQDSLYYRQLYEITSEDFINGISIQSIQDQINFFNELAYYDSLNGNPYSAIYYGNENDKMQKVKTATDELKNGNISINEFYFRFLNNHFYDQVNMGTENFVKGSFDDLFRRAPNETELNAAIKMVDNQPSTLFLQSGSNKGDYMNIVTTNDAFYEGLVRRYYQQYLLRNPNSQEIFSGINAIKPTNDFITIQKQILISNEYAGF